jgi:hypothetical protein
VPAAREPSGGRPIATITQQIDEVGVQMEPLAAYILKQLGVDPAAIGNQPNALLCRKAAIHPNPKLKLAPEVAWFYGQLSWFLDQVADNLPNPDPNIPRPKGMAKRQ